VGVPEGLFVVGEGVVPFGVALGVFDGPPVLFGDWFVPHAIRQKASAERKPIILILRMISQPPILMTEVEREEFHIEK
jgi:hypothetical protein